MGIDRLGCRCGWFGSGAGGEELCSSTVNREQEWKKYHHTKIAGDRNISHLPLRFTEKTVSSMYVVVFN